MAKNNAGKYRQKAYQKRQCGINNGGGERT